MTLETPAQFELSRIEYTRPFRIDGLVNHSSRATGKPKKHATIGMMTRYIGELEKEVAEFRAERKQRERANAL